MDGRSFGYMESSSEKANKNIDVFVGQSLLIVKSLVGKK